MSFLAFAKQHLRVKFPEINPSLASCISGKSFTLHKRSHSNCIVFFNNAAQPAIIYKATRNDSVNGLFENAVECRRKCKSLNVRTQSLYDSGHFQNRAFMVLEWTPGSSLKDVRKNIAMDDPLFKFAMETITDLHCRTAQNAIGDIAGLEKRAQEWRDLIFSFSFIPASVGAAVDTTLANLLKWMRRVPAVVMHGDCRVENFIRNSHGDLTLIDWELGLPIGPPVIDIACMLLNHRLDASNQGLTNSLRSCFIDATPEKDKCWQFVSSYADRVKLPKEAIPTLIAASLISLVAEGRRYFISHHGAFASEMFLNDMLALEEWLEYVKNSANL